MLGRILGVLGRSLNVLGRILGVLGRNLGVLGRSLDVLGCSLIVLGRSLGMLGRSLDVLARSLEGRPTCQGQYKVQGPVQPARQCNWMCFAQFNPACYTRGAIISPVLLDVLCICCWRATGVR